MGNEGSKSGRRSSLPSNMSSSFSSESHRSYNLPFPNCISSLDEAYSWNLLHQCSVHEWRNGHAEPANFSEKVVSCDRVLKKDCEKSFCISRQSIVNLDKGNSLFQFRRKMKFSKMAEHFEYNYIPAQMSSVNNFRVKRILCTKDSLVVLQLAQNDKCQFGLLDMSNNKFKVFGKKFVEAPNEDISVSLSPDNSKCLIQRRNLTHTLCDPVVLSHSHLITKPPPTSLQYDDWLNPNQDSDYNGHDDHLNINHTNTDHDQYRHDDRDYPRGHHLRSNNNNINTNNTNNNINTNNTNNNVDDDDDARPIAPRRWPELSTRRRLSFIDRRISYSELLLFDLTSMQLLSCIVFNNPHCHFSFDPRFAWSQVAITNLSQTYAENTLSIVSLTAPSCAQLETHDAESNGGYVRKSRVDVTLSGGQEWRWVVTSRNDHLLDFIHPEDYPYPTSLHHLVDLQHTKDGRFLVATVIDHVCMCHHLNNNRNHLYQSMSSLAANALTPINCSLYVLSSDSAQTLRRVCFTRYICVSHTCPSNYMPIYSDCGGRIAVGVDNVPPNILQPPAKRYPSRPQFVQVFSLPSNHRSLQALCRTVILQHIRGAVYKLKLPAKILNYLRFCSEFEP